MGANGTDVSHELERLQKWRTPHEQVTFPDGEHVHVRQLSPADAMLLSESDPETGLKTLALSLCTPDGVRLFGPETLAAGVALVGEWPAEYVSCMNPAIARLNGYGEDLAEVSRRD